MKWTIAGDERSGISIVAQVRFFSFFLVPTQSVGMLIWRLCLPRSFSVQITSEVKSATQFDRNIGIDFNEDFTQSIFFRSIANKLLLK